MSLWAIVSFRSRWSRWSWFSWFTLLTYHSRGGNKTSTSISVPSTTKAHAHQPPCCVSPQESYSTLWKHSPHSKGDKSSTLRLVLPITNAQQYTHLKYYNTSDGNASPFMKVPLNTSRTKEVEEQQKHRKLNFNLH